MKILIDLNMREKITMIMVTHDVGLKAFAHRVVKMADGKVNKIKTTPHATRQGIINELNRSVRSCRVIQDSAEVIGNTGFLLTHGCADAFSDHKLACIDA